MPCKVPTCSSGGIQRFLFKANHDFSMRSHSHTHSRQWAAIGSTLGFSILRRETSACSWEQTTDFPMPPVPQLPQSHIMCNNQARNTTWMLQCGWIHSVCPNSSNHRHTTGSSQWCIHSISGSLHSIRSQDLLDQNRGRCLHLDWTKGLKLTRLAHSPHVAS